MITCVCKLPYHDVCLGEDGEIEFFYVRRDRQSQGLGQRLINEALSWLATLTCNLKAHKFYAHYGFIQVGDYYSSLG